MSSQPSPSTLKNAQRIVDNGGVVIVTEDQEWHVQGTRDTYSVTRAGDGFYCERLDQDESRNICKGWQFLKGVPQEDRYCKHTEAVKIAWLNQDAHVKAYYKQKGGD